MGLSVWLLGPIRASWHGREVALGGRSGAALLSLLITRGRAWGREEIATQIWPEAGTEWSRRLRQSLWIVRRGLAAAGADPAAILAVDHDSVGLNADVAADVDALRFEGFVNRRPPDLEAALLEYAGDLAEGLMLECLVARREYLASLYEDALAGAARMRLSAGDLDGARRAAFQLLERDPLREDAYAVLMEAFGILGSRSQVHRLYRRLCHILATELEVSPLAETDAVYLDAMARVGGRSPRRLAGHSADRLH